jgi:hypothetical protein
MLFPESKLMKMLLGLVQKSDSDWLNGKNGTP